MRFVLVLAVVAGCKSPRKEEPTAVPSTCTIAVTNPGNAITVDGIPLPNFAPATLERVLGKPDRVERVTKQQRYEEYGDGDTPPTSDLITVTNVVYVYDRRGLVFPTSRGMFDEREEADRMIVFFGNDRVFDNVEPPPVIPKQRGTCGLTVNGIVLDPAKDLRPAGVTYRTEEAALFGMAFGFTSIATQIDGLYSKAGGRHVHVLLDGRQTGRAAYVELR